MTSTERRENSRHSQSWRTPLFFSIRRFNIIGSGYLDNILLYKEGKEVFEDDFDDESFSEMPSRWKFFGGTIGEAIVRRDPKDPSNKVFFINSPTNDQKWLAAVARRNGGVPYLVSNKDYDYRLIYKSHIKPYYRIYDLSPE